MGWAISVGDDLYQLGEGAGMGSEIALLTDFSMGIHVLCVCVCFSSGILQPSHWILDFS